MRNILTLTRREWLSYFYSPFAYIVMTAFVLFVGFFFYSYVKSYQDSDAWRFIIGIVEQFTALIIAPILTMRLLAEEKRQGTLEMLMTAPITELEIVLAKFLAVLSFYIFLLIPTAAYMLLLALWGKPDFGALISGYIGLVLMTGVFLAIGLFFSSLTSHQLVAALFTFVFILLLFLLDWLSQSLTGWTREVAEYAALWGHLENFGKGLIDSRDVVYALSIIIFFLFLTVRVVESKRWR